MTERTTSCDHERLRLLIANELPSEREAEAAEHVADCPRCQEKLESLAGGQDWWMELQRCFGERAISIAASGASSASNDSQAADSDDDDKAFAADFAVDFLEPCERSATLGRIGDVEILEAIGRGGMGIVMKGYQRELGRYVAVKLMAPHLAASSSARKRFDREARAAAAIVHPHVMPIHSVNASSRLPYLVMPFVDCESLQQRLDRDGPLELREILRIGHQVAAALAAAHAQGLVHRDVKPANILLERGVDRAMLTDFGLARAVDDGGLTRTGAIAGTPRFMSPEQARGETIDARSDLFSLGSVMYAMCTGHPPFRAETSFGVMRRISDVEPRPIQELNSDLPDWLATITSRLLAKNPDDRFQSAVDFTELMAKCLSHVQQPTNVPLPESINRHATKASRNRQRTKTAIRIGLAGLVLLGLIAAYFGGVPNPLEQRDEAPGDNLLSLKVIRLDQNSARSVMNRLDRNRDDQLDNKEQRGLEWSNADKRRFDLDQSSTLTRTEIAIWYAHRREVAGVTESDVNNARKAIVRRDRNGDYRLSEEEVAESKWPANPVEYDLDRDGVLTIFEVASRFSIGRQERRESGVMGVDHTYAIQIMARYDQDKNRQLDKAEAQDVPIPREWKAVDKNKDGKLSIAELGRLLSADRVKRGVTTSDSQRAHLLVSRYDRDSDGQVDADDRILDGSDIAEGHAFWPAELSESDADQNGQITVRELEDYFAQQRKEAASARGVTTADQTIAAQLLFRYDTNRNDHVDMDETDNPPVGVAEITVITFVEFDEDFDEQLSQAELAKFIAKRRYEVNVIEKQEE